MYDTTGGYAPLADVRAWIQVPATVLTDEQLELVAGAEQVQQAAYCHWDEAAGLPDTLYQAHLRRVARHVAAKGVPLGLIGLDAEYGTSRLVRWDAEIDRLEAPHVSVVIA
jgi:hypothetical protein